MKTNSPLRFSHPLSIQQLLLNRLPARELKQCTFFFFKKRKNKTHNFISAQKGPPLNFTKVNPLGRHIPKCKILNIGLSILCFFLDLWGRMNVVGYVQCSWCWGWHRTPSAAWSSYIYWFSLRRASVCLHPGQNISWSHKTVWFILLLFLYGVCTTIHFCKIFF